jgi:hypothetical protein
LDQFLGDLRVLSIFLIPAAAIAAVLYVLWAGTLPLLLRYGRAARFARWRAKPRLTVLASIIAFAYFIWPTPWIYMTLGDESFRVNALNRYLQIRQHGKWVSGGACGNPFLNYP